MAIIPFTNEELLEIIKSKNAGATWEEVVELVNEKYGNARTYESVRSAYRRNIMSVDEHLGEAVKTLQDIAKLRKDNTKKNKHNSAVIKYLNSAESVLEQIQEAIKTIKFEKVKLPSFKRDSSKKDMTLELLVSDVHYGKKTKTFNSKICRKRMKELTRTVIAEIRRNQRLYNVEELIIALIGDLIENATMHELESMRSSEFSNARQVQLAIESLFQDLILPIANIGIKIRIPCVTGNHDRDGHDQTMINQGEENLSWIIYNTLELLSKAHGLKNVTFVITDGSFLIERIYGNNVLYEHGHNMKMGSINRKTMENFMNMRASQTKKVIDFFRCGHWHEPTSFGRGRIMINGSVQGTDSYSELLGFSSDPVQILNFYIDSDQRPTCFYKSFPILLS